MWLVIGSGMLMLLIAAMGKQKRESCKGYSIILKGDEHEELFLDKESISGVLVKAAHNNIKGQPKSSLNLQEMEEALESNAWVKDAQLYFDNHTVLHVSVTERKPIARIFTAGGKSFYMDENDYRMPLSAKMVAKLPVFTGFPDKKVLTKSDSALLNDIKETAQFINGNSFWTSQVAQIDIVADCGPDCWEFEMTPVVGNHIVKLGDGENIDKKFNRLFAFYQQVLNKTGFNKYKTIDVRFAGQVVGSKDGKSVNAVPLPRPAENIVDIKPVASPVQKPAETKTEKKDTKKVIATNKPAATKTKEIQVSTSPQPSETFLKDEKKTPKAVMKKKE